MPARASRRQGRGTDAGGGCARAPAVAGLRLIVSSSPLGSAAVFNPSQPQLSSAAGSPWCMRAWGRGRSCRTGLGMGRRAPWGRSQEGPDPHSALGHYSSPGHGGPDDCATGAGAHVTAAPGVPLRAQPAANLDPQSPPQAARRPGTDAPVPPPSCQQSLARTVFNLKEGELEATPCPPEWEGTSK